jgi:minor extracellular serine protease Vpr
MKRLWMAVCVPVLSAQVVPGKYIVELAGPAAADMVALHATGKRAAALGAIPSVRAQQARVRPRLESLGAKVVANVDTVANALIVEVADGSAPTLAAEPGVARVTPVPLLRMSLDHALPLLGVPEAWATLGGISHAGARIKIGIIDSGISAGHPGFQDDSLPVPEGFPIVTNFAGTAFTNHKIIVARTYGSVSSPRDLLGHGTAVAMTAAGVTNTGPLATITGIAPAAWLGNYKVNDQISFEGSLLLTALDDAVKDGMDVINISAGIAVSGPVDGDPLVSAVERASALGVVVVLAAGNEGPSANTINSPASAPSAIAVGASENDRMFVTASVQVDGSGGYVALLSTGAQPNSPITGPVRDVSEFDPTGEACGPLPPNSLAGGIALIVRSPRAGNPCTFESKLTNAQNAGAVAAIVYMNQDSPDLIKMDVRLASLPAVSVESPSGLDLKRRLQLAPLTATIHFSSSALARNANLIAPFSSRGPNVDLGIKPDVVAPGDFLYTATQKTDPSGLLFDASGYLTNAAGTSFAAPLVTGAVAVVKGARGGLTAAQYRSLIINSATPMPASAGVPFPVQWTGAGVLNLNAALRSTVAVNPVSIGFGSATGTVDITKLLAVTNLGTSDDSFTLSIAPVTGIAPTLQVNTLRLAPGESRPVTVRLTAAAPATGASQGYLRIRSSGTDVETTVPYWFASTDQQPFQIPVLSAPASGRSGSLQRINFRVVDRSGVPVSNVFPTVRAISGEGTVANVTRGDLNFQAQIRLGDFGANVFEIDAGAASIQVSIESQ